MKSKGKLQGGAHQTYTRSECLLLDQADARSSCTFDVRHPEHHQNPARAVSPNIRILKTSFNQILKMSESRTSRFLRFLSRIRSARPLAEEDVESLSHLPINSNEEREEEEIHYANQAEAIEQFLMHGFRTYKSAEFGFAAFGWKELPAGGGPEILKGAFASVSLAYKLSDRGLPLETRHLTAAKIQKICVPKNFIRDYSRVWREVEILKGLVHGNIIGFYGMFAVDPELEKDHTDSYKDRYPDKRLFWILLEYANAGDMAKEIRRYKSASIPEPGARYYMLQICAGVQCMHHKRIVHNDLHTRNILLKYKPNGTKVCMICDFGMSIIVKPEAPIVCRRDVSAIFGIAAAMMLPKSKKGVQLVSGRRKGHPVPMTIPELLAFPWFDGPVQAPIPKEPTPILQPEVVEQIGYLPPLDAAGTTSPGPVAHVVHPQPDEIVPHARASSSAQRVAHPPPDEIEAEIPSDSRGGSFAHRMRERLRSIPHHVRTRIRSLPCVGGRAARRASEPEIELEEMPSRRRHEH